MAAGTKVLPPPGVTRAAAPPTARRGRPTTSRKSWSALLWVAPALVGLGLFVYYPLVLNFVYSVQRTNIFSGQQQFVGLDNYARLAADPVFWKALTNNGLYAVISIVFQVFGALLLAAIIENLRSTRLRAVLRSIYFLPSVISLTVTGLLFSFIYQPRAGLLNGILGGLGLDSLQHAWLGEPKTAMLGIILMSQWQGFGYSTLLFAVAIQRVPRELLEAMSLDGAGAVRQIFALTIPMVREMTGLMMIVTMSGAFQVFNEVMVTTAGGPNNSTQVLGTWLYQSGFIKNDFGYAAAIATVIFLITLVLALVQLRYTSRRRIS
jgi:raffinose/stachyose/melibiose transport system permease protein